MAKTAKSITFCASSNVYHCQRNQKNLNEAFMTDQAKHSNKANAYNLKIFVNIQLGHFWSNPHQERLMRKQGVLIGESYEDKMEWRWWGAHLPHVAGIAEQSNYGVQLVALSQGYEEIKNHGEWFL